MITHSLKDLSAPLPEKSHGRVYYPAFDGIRALAILAVFINHYSVASYGRLGVCVFFVLSGFLITGILLRNRGLEGALKRFYVRRTLRIFPLYFAVWIGLIFLTVPLHIFWNKGNMLYLIYAGNYIWTFFGDRYTAPFAMVHLGFGRALVHGLPTHMFYVGHFWTLAVEEQFYLFWPFLILRPKSAKAVLRICVGVIVAVTCAKVAFAFLSSGFPSQITRITFLRCDEFAVGGLLATLLHLGKGKALLGRANWILAAGTLMLLLSCVVNSEIGAILPAARWDFLVNIPAADIFAVGMILVGIAPGNAIGNGLSLRPLVWLGKMSYGFYIFHDLAHPLISELVNWQFAQNSETLRDAMTAIYALAITLAVSYVSFRFLETPFLKMKEWWPEKGLL